MSLCTGIGGIDLAAEWAGLQNLSEVEIHAQKDNNRQPDGVAAVQRKS